MDKQIEEMARIMCNYNAKNFESCGECLKGLLSCGMLVQAERLYNAGCRNISKAAADCLAGEDVGLKILDHYIQKNHELKAKNKEIRKETAEKFAEMAKERKIEMGTDGHSYCMVFVYDIDEICKEITGKN